MTDKDKDERRKERKRKQQEAARLYQQVLGDDANTNDDKADKKESPDDEDDGDDGSKTKKAKTMEIGAEGQAAVPQTTQSLIPNSLDPKSLVNLLQVRGVPTNFKVYVLLEMANLETVKVGKEGGYQLLNADDHQNIIRKTKRDLGDCRPDITHQCLLALLDSPLNKAGRLVVYIRTRKNVLIEIHPDTRIPRTMKRFSGLMVELLQKLKVRATNSPDPLLKVIRNPIMSHLPLGCHKVLMTYNCETVLDTQEHAIRMAKRAASWPQETTEAAGSGISSVMYVIGAIAHGKVDLEWEADETISISNYPLSGANVCFKVTDAFEKVLGIL
mmetsp:Transcript_10203/g.17515  ORF Transcript_10203/g.17515 Transcript_10203/m.17515 type:complete len:329 (+) Transcript_10203:74-1060(+)